MIQHVGIVTFPGSNGDHDAWSAFANDLGVPARMIDYRETNLSDVAAVIVPGGFSYGDYLRCGAIARFAPVITSIRSFAERGGPVLGICNGFQILTEAHMLPGALLRNESLRFHCDWIHVRVEATSFWSSGIAPGTVLRLPIAHGDGSYFADDQTIQMLESNGRVIFRYCDPSGAVLDNANPNGSRRAIAGIANEAGNVVGLMPHPERATSDLIGGDDGLSIIRSVLDVLQVPA
ncbi:MAG: phosphoribosylformylglycinamidine synthase subunit PurQ [Thermomicrobiales bacterium]